MLPNDVQRFHELVDPLGGHPVPTEIHRIIVYEDAGIITDLETGQTFSPKSDWLDLARRWRHEQWLAGLPVTWSELTKVLKEADEHNDRPLSIYITPAQSLLRTLVDFDALEVTQ